MPGPTPAITGDEESRKLRISVLGPETGRYYDKLYNRYVYLRELNNEFKQAFFETPNLSVIHPIAPRFVARTQSIWYESLLMGICRLTDNATKGSEESLAGLPKAMENRPAVRNELSKRLKRARKACGFARTWRNCRIAHTDMERERDVPAFSAEDVERAVDAIHLVVEVVEDKVFNRYMDLNMWKTLRIPVLPAGGAQSLVRHVETSDERITELAAWLLEKTDYAGHGAEDEGSGVEKARAVLRFMRLPDSTYDDDFSRVMRFFNWAAVIARKQKETGEVLRRQR